MCLISLATSLATSLGAALGIGVGAAATTAATGAAAAAGATAAGAIGGGALAAGTAAAVGTTAVVAGTAATTASVLGTAGAIGLGALAVGGAVAGGVTSTVSGIQQAQIQEAQANYLADQSSANAQIAARQAEAIQLQGNQQRSQLRNDMLQTKGDARAKYAAAGVVLGQGTPADYEADIADAYDLDRRNLDYDIASRAWQQKVASVNFQNQGSIYQSQANAFRGAQRVSLLNGTLGTAANTASSLGSALSLSDKFDW